VAAVEARLNQAEEASSKIGRKDWALLLTGTFVTLVVTELLPPAPVLHIAKLTFEGLEFLYEAG